MAYSSGEKEVGDGGGGICLLFLPEPTLPLKYLGILHNSMAAEAVEKDNSLSKPLCYFMMEAMENATA